MAGTIPFGCGQCLPCRINRSRQWKWRQIFESFDHEENCFVTLTYADDYRPPDGHLVPNDLRLWLMRLRKALAPTPLRYFAVGEYGERTLRPHYHLSLFGMSGTSLHQFRGSTVLGETVIQETWDRGLTYTTEFTSATAGYVTGYIAKKLTDRKTGRIDHLVPEFARMSLKPGLGANSMLTAAKALMTEHGQHFMENNGDIPRDLRLGKQKIPLPRHLIQKLRFAVGFTDERVAEIKAQKTYDKSLEMLALYSNASASLSGGSLTFKAAYAMEVEQKIRNIEAKSKIRSPKRDL